MANWKSKLIAFDELESAIIEAGFCTLCGACEAACPLHAIAIEDDRPRRLYNCSEHIDSCPICYDICPHTDAFLLETLRFVADSPRRRESLGYYKEIMLARATDTTAGDVSRSGGVVNSLLSFMIKEGIIDSAIFSEAVSRPGIGVKPSISLTADDMLSALDVKIVPSAVAKAFGRAIFEYGRVHVAFVGVPCHITALRKLEAWQHKMMDSLEVTIGLFCLWTFSLSRLLDYFSQKYGIEAHDIQGVELTMNDYVLHTNGGTFKVPLPEVKPYIMSRCRTCVDFTSELADLSVGGASPLSGWSTVITRTRKGEELLERAVREGVISVKSIESEPEVMAHVIQLSTFKREVALREIREMKRARDKVPPATEALMAYMTPVSMDLGEVKVEDVMTRDVVTLSPNTNVKDFFEEVARHHHTGFPITDELNRVVGIVTLQDAIKVEEGKRGEVYVSDICTKELVSVFADDSLRVAIEKMNRHDVGRLLVVAKDDERLLLGIVTRSDIVHALRKFV